MTFEHKLPPFDHQKRIFEETRDLETYGLLWEQGTGKTKPIIDTAAWLYEKGEIDAVVVVAPNGVHRNWITDEIPAHLTDGVAKVSSYMSWQSTRAGTQWHQNKFTLLVAHKGLAWLCIPYTAFITKPAKLALWRFLKARRVLYVLDESHHAKTPGAKRTKSIIASGKYAPYRRIMTGTPAEKPFDVYSQIRFLKPDIWADMHMENFQAFKQYFGIWKSRAEVKVERGYDPGYDQLLDYKNLDQLAKIIAGVTDRVLKKDVLDLPEKLYTKVYFEMSPKQRTAYDRLKAEFMLELESGEILDGSLAIVRLLRLQQITCGYVAAFAGDPVEMVDKVNPRLEATLAFLEGLNHQAIIWSRFTKDVDILCAALGDRAVRYDGQLDDDEAERNKQAFNAGEAQWFVGNPAKGAEGLTLVASKTMLFYANSFRLLQRLQAEDRQHRIGQEGINHGEHGFGVLYADVCCYDSVDQHIITALRKKLDIASVLTGDDLKTWI